MIIREVSQKSEYGYGNHIIIVYSIDPKIARDYKEKMLRCLLH